MWQNVIDVLELVPLASMCQYKLKLFCFIHFLTDSLARFASRFLCFVDAYDKSLDRKWAAWATKRYCGHWIIPTSIFADIAIQEEKEMLEREKHVIS